MNKYSNDLVFCFRMTDEFWLSEAGCGVALRADETTPCLVPGGHDPFLLLKPHDIGNQIEWYSFHDINPIMNTARRNAPRAPVTYRASCDRCRRGFVNERALEQHNRASPRHNICPGCDFDYITRDEMEEASALRSPFE
jgi:hypothetical protein